MSRKIKLNRHDRNEIVIQRPLIGIFIVFHALEKPGKPVVIALVGIRPGIEFLDPS